MSGFDAFAGVPASQVGSPWSLDGGYLPDVDRLRGMLQSCVADGLWMARQGGDLGLALDLWVADELRRAGFEPDAVWPRQSDPRVLPWAVSRALSKMPPAMRRSPVADRFVKGAGSTSPIVHGEFFPKSVDVLVADWDRGIELMVSTKAMISSFGKNLTNRWEEFVGDLRRRAGRVNDACPTHASRWDHDEAEIDLAVQDMREKRDYVLPRLMRGPRSRRSGRGSDAGYHRMPAGMLLPARVAVAAGALVLLAATPVLGQDGSSPASPAPPTTGAEPWGQVPFEAGLRHPYGASRITAVASGPRGIVAVGISPTGAAAWFSSDGLDWQRASPPRSWTRTGQFDWYPSLEDVVATDEGFVVVGTEHDGPKRSYRNIGSVWTSDDGLSWRRSARGVGPYLTHVIEHEGRLYAISGGVHGRIEGAVWTSDDAVIWERVHTATEDAGMEIIASYGETIVAGSHRGMAYSADDGRTWHEAPFEVGGADSWLEDATAFDGGFIAVGARNDDGAAWRSVDGRSWEAVPETLDTGAYITSFNSVATLPTGGVLATAGTDDQESFLYRSEDGETWFGPLVSAAGDDDSGEWPFEDVVALGDGSLVVGEQPDGPRRFSAAVWTTPPPLDGASPGIAATSCPGRRPKIEGLVVMDPTARLDCFGDRSLRFQAWLAANEYGDLEYFGLPHWLTAGVGGLRALPVKGSSATMSLVLHVRQGDSRRLDPPTGRWAIVMGHFDDPAAGRCAGHWRKDCRQAFIVTKIKPVRERRRGSLQDRRAQPGSSGRGAPGGQP